MGWLRVAAVAIMGEGDAQLRHPAGVKPSPCCCCWTWRCRGDHLLINRRECLSFTCLLLFSDSSNTPPAPPPLQAVHAKRDAIKDANERGRSPPPPQLPTTCAHARLYPETRVRDTGPEEPRVGSELSRRVLVWIWYPNYSLASSNPAGSDHERLGSEGQMDKAESSQVEQGDWA